MGVRWAPDGCHMGVTRAECRSSVRGTLVRVRARSEWELKAGAMAKDRARPRVVVRV